jgi:hypothetical protein
LYIRDDDHADRDAPMAATPQARTSRDHVTATAASGDLLNAVLKNFFLRPRPEIAEEREKVE